MAEHAPVAFTGEGAASFGGRWNSVGVPVVYVAGSAALAALELLVHLELEDLYEEFVLFEVGFEESLVEAVGIEKFPRNWQSELPEPELQQIGDEWAASARSVVLRVPSAIIDDDWNYLLNPLHREFRKIKLGKPRKFRFDSRLIK